MTDPTGQAGDAVLKTERRGGQALSGRGADPLRRSEKSPQAFRTISEVAQDLDVPPHVLRFWETKFNQVRPLKRGGGRRYYRPEDVELLRRIRGLLYREGYTIKGVQRVLREGGPQAIDPHSVGRNGDAAAANGHAPPAAGRNETGVQSLVAPQAALQTAPDVNAMSLGDDTSDAADASSAALSGLRQNAADPGSRADPGTATSAAPPGTAPLDAAGSLEPTVGMDGTDGRDASDGTSEDRGSTGSGLAAPEHEQEAATATELLRPDPQRKHQLNRILIDLKTVRDILQQELRQSST